MHQRFSYLSLALVLLDHPALLVPVVRVLEVVLSLERKVPPALKVHPVFVEVVDLYKKETWYVNSRISLRFTT